MPVSTTFDSRVAARTRAAEQVLRSKELLSLYEAVGGLKSDLEEIRDLGQQAEALSSVRSGRKAAAGAATLTVLHQFADLQREYVAVMAVAVAVRRDLQRAGATEKTLSALDRILENEAQVTLSPAPVPAADAKATPGGTTRGRKARRSQSQEAIRAEIARDAAGLLSIKEAHAGLSKRGVSVKRLGALAEAAAALSASLAGRAETRGQGEAATASLSEIVTQQRLAWGACYRLLTAVASQDDRVRLLLTEAAARKPARKKPTK
jgi:hypothetical protein